MTTRRQAVAGEHLESSQSGSLVLRTARSDLQDRSNLGRVIFRQPCFLSCINGTKETTYENVQTSSHQEKPWEAQCVERQFDRTLLLIIPLLPFVECRTKEMSLVLDTPGLGHGKNLSVLP